MVIEEGNLNLESSPYSIFILSIILQVTKGKYLQRIGYFLDFVGIKQGTIEERCNTLASKPKLINVACEQHCEIPTSTTEQNRKKGDYRFNAQKLHQTH